jgi:two-component system sensor histidine kinase/response regulator
MNESTDDVAIYDDAVLLSLAMHDRALANELVRIFLDEAPRYVVRLTQAIEANDARAIRSLAHSLKGSAVTVTAGHVAAAATRLEAVGVSTVLADAPRLLAQLHAALRELNDRLTAL